MTSTKKYISVPTPQVEHLESLLLKMNVSYKKAEIKGSAHWPQDHVGEEWRDGGLLFTIENVNDTFIYFLGVCMCDLANH